MTTPRASAPPDGRRAYLDWLRGVAVLIMIGAHTFDSWTLPADRQTAVYGWIVRVAGFGAPLFLFLAGVSVAFAARARAARLGSDAAGARAVRRRGWQIFLYAFLFRLQSWVLNPGAPISSLLRVDILNVMGPSIVGAATLWRAGRGVYLRVAVLAGATVAVAMLTPVVRALPWLGVLPDPVEWYLRPVPGRTNFTLFPWSGFVLAGAAAGVILQRASDAAHERRVIAGFALAGALIAGGGYGASYLPPLYETVSFWTSSPTFFFLRAGLLLAGVAAAWAWDRRPWAPSRQSRLGLLGVESLFVYWIHVEIVYGWLTAPLHRVLPLPWAAVAFGGFTVLMYAAAVLKRRVATRWRGRAGGLASGRLGALRQGSRKNH